MANRINVKLVLELLSKGMSARELGVPVLLEAIGMVEGDPSYAGLAFADKAKVVIDTLDTAQMRFMLELTEHRPTCSPIIRQPSATQKRGPGS